MVGPSSVRLENVSSRLLKGEKETDIAKALGVSRKTIVRDVACLKKSSKTWLNGLAKNGFIYEYKLALDKIKDHERELQRLYLQTNDGTEKINILKALDGNTKLYIELLGEAPTVQSLRKALGREDVQTT